MRNKQGTVNPANSSANSAAGGVLTPQIPLLAGLAELCQPIDIMNLFFDDRALSLGTKADFPCSQGRAGRLKVAAGVDRDDRSGGVRQVSDRGHHRERHIVRLDRTLERGRERRLRHHLLGTAGDKAGMNHAGSHDDDADFGTEHAGQRHAHRVECRL